ncbi:DUF6538 domain-containing protein [Vibrio cyclitrophicus]
MRYLSQRSSGIWYFRYQIPLKLRTNFSGKSEFKKSLNTRCRNTAKLRASKLQQGLWESLLLIEKGNGSANVLKDFLSPLTHLIPVEENNVWRFSEAEKSKIIHKLANCLETLEQQPKLLRAQKKRIDLRAENGSEFIKSIAVIESLWDRHTTPLQVVKNYLSQLPYGENQNQQHFLEEIENTAIALCQYVQKFQASLDQLDLHGAKCILRKIERYEWLDIKTFDTEHMPDDEWEKPLPVVSNEIINSEPAQDNVEKSNYVDVGSVLEAYLLEKNKGKIAYNKNGELILTKNQKAIRAGTLLLHEFLETNDMCGFNQIDVSRILPMVIQFPKNARSLHKKHFDGLNAFEVIEKNKELKLDLRNESQALRDFGNASTLYNWAVEKKLIPHNLFKGIAESKSGKKQNTKGLGVDDVHGSKTKKLPFTDDDIRALFSHPVYTQGKISVRTGQRLNYQYWVMLIALTSGARPNEICQLRVADVQFRDGILCFLIQTLFEGQSVKTVNAIRVIPVHDKLLDLGFMDYLRSVQGKELLFPELTFTEASGYYGKVEDWFYDHFTTKMGLTAQKKSFYSFRHKFAADYESRGADCGVFEYLFAHEPDKFSRKHYGGKFEVSVLKNKIEEMDVSGFLSEVLPYVVE